MTKEQIKEVFCNAVLNQINGDRNHGWGLKDSMAVIRAVALVPLSEGTVTLEEVEGYVEAVVNPSQFRQKLEGVKEAGKALSGVLNAPVKKAKAQDVLGDLM